MSERITINASEVRTHQAIHLGTLKAAGIILLGIIGSAGVIVGWWPYYAGSTAPNVMSADSVLMLCGFCLVGIAVVAGWRFFPRYVSLNLLGFYLWIWLKDDGTKEYEISRGPAGLVLYPPPQIIDATKPLPRVILALSLNSKYINESRIFTRVYDKLQMSEHWRIKLVRMIELDGKGTIIVQLQDRTGASVELHVDKVIQLLDDYNVWPLELGDIPQEQWTRLQKTYKSTISDLLRWFLLCDDLYREAGARAKEQEKETEELRKSKTRLLGTVLWAIEKIKESTRFGRSREGRAIRGELTKQVLELLIPDDLQRPVFENDLVEIQKAEAREYAATRKLMERNPAPKT